MTTLHQLLNFLFIGYVVSAILLNLAYVILRSKRKVLDELNELSNWVLVAASSLFLLSILWALMRVWLWPNEAEFRMSPDLIFGPYAFAFWITVLFKGVIPQLLWFPRIRGSIWTSLLLIPFIFFDHYIDSVIQFFINRNRDYLPSTYITEGPSLFEVLVPSFLYMSILAVAYLIKSKSKVA